VQRGSVAAYERIVALDLRLRLVARGSGTIKMRILGIVALGAALGGCASSAAPATDGGMVTNSFSVPNCFSSHGSIDP
jgi:hypothetical protein